MTAALSSAPPRRILLATDLRSRSDRAVIGACQAASGCASGAATRNASSSWQAASMRTMVG